MSPGCCLLLELNLWPQKWCRYDLPYWNIENHVSKALTEHLLKNCKLPKLCVGRLCSCGVKWGRVENSLILAFPFLFTERFTRLSNFLSFFSVFQRTEYPPQMLWVMYTSATYQRNYSLYQMVGNESLLVFSRFSFSCQKYCDKFDLKNYFIRVHILLITVPFIGSINSRGIKNYQWVIQSRVLCDLGPYWPLSNLKVFARATMCEHIEIKVMQSNKSVNTMHVKLSYYDSAVHTY